MPPLMIRQLWSLVETTQATTLVNLDDSSLVQWLLNLFGDQQALDAEESNLLANYIHTRISLIRDLAYDRIAT
ncbi:hypothetical protein GS601_20180 [Myxacorys almedinensis A]|uniref:Uncharacterized protein n=2 Tax=Myxacorys TaxID=2056239 RepID=A0A8J7ZCP8_9CYAN|nr:hypothetical protein [Myxacorys almedinensis A]